MNYRDALVQSKSDVEKLLRFAAEELDRMEYLHGRYKEITDQGDRVVITFESREISNDFEMTRDQLGKYLEDELGAITHLLWKQITRPDEKRKFTRMRNALEKVVVPFLGDPEDYYKTGVSAGTDPKEYVEQTLKTLRYLKNYWHRIERYQKVQREIKHGPFTIVNEYGYQPGEYERELGYFDEAATRVGKMGFDSLLYGDVALTTLKALGGSFIGMYYGPSDKVYIAVDWVNHTTDKREQPVPVLIHEFGHRLWRKFLPAEAQAQFVSAYGWINSQDVEAWWNSLVGNSLSLAKTKKEHPYAADEIEWRWKKALRIVKKEEQMSAKRIRQIFTDTEPELKEWEYRVDVSKERLLKMLKTVFVGRKWYDTDSEPKPYYKPRKGPASSGKHVTWYGKKSPEEEFCERFMFWCMGWKMDQEMESELLVVLRQTNG
jgi:hypothetical protein